MVREVKTLLQPALGFVYLIFMTVRGEQSGGRKHFWYSKRALTRLMD